MKTFRDIYTLVIEGLYASRDAFGYVEVDHDLQLHIHISEGFSTKRGRIEFCYITPKATWETFGGCKFKLDTEKQGTCKVYTAYRGVWNLDNILTHDIDDEIDIKGIPNENYIQRAFMRIIDKFGEKNEE
jgi:hypothetical protein